MMHLGQTIRKKNSDELYLYLGIDIGGTGEVYLVNESGVKVVVENRIFFTNYTHIQDKKGKPVIGKYALEDLFFGVLMFQDDMLPDLELKSLLVQGE